MLKAKNIPVIDLAEVLKEMNLKSTDFMFTEPEAEFYPIHCSDKVVNRIEEYLKIKKPYPGTYSKEIENDLKLVYLLRSYGYNNMVLIRNNDWSIYYE